MLHFGGEIAIQRHALSLRIFSIDARRIIASFYYFASFRLFVFDEKLNFAKAIYAISPAIF